jgi:hypothetical protein
MTKKEHIMTLPRLDYDDLINRVKIAKAKDLEDEYFMTK